MRLQIIVILLAVVGIAIGLAQLGEEYITITVTSEGKSKISQTLFPKTFVSTIDVHIISEKISNLLAIDEKNILLGTTQNKDLLKIATLGASAVDLKYNADILTYESGIFRLKYDSELESRVSLPPLSKLVSLNTIPIEITDEYVLPPGDISLSFTIRPVTSNEFFVTVGDSEQKVETITAAKIEEFSANADEIQFIIKDKAIVLTIIPKVVMTNPNDALLNGEEVDFRLFYQNSTHSWVRIDPHEKGLVRILDTGEKSDEGGGCLIATATYGSEMAPQVQFLREIRDNQLMKTDSGLSFMTGFNQFYYLFSPYIADLERENPTFKEFVKIGISPMLLSLSIMTVAESENEILGFGIGVILINIGMYLVLPFVICYYVKKIIRTTRMKKSNLRVKFNCHVLSAVKTSLFGLIVLVVLSVSVSSAFAQEVPESPIKIILDITKENAGDALEDDPPSTAVTLYSMGVIEYDKAIAALELEPPDIEAAEEFALIAMALFEDATETAGVFGDTLVLDQLPPGFGAGVGSASEEGLEDGQGLGVGGIPPGIMKQLTAADIFNLQNEITEIEFDADNLRELVSANNFDVDFSEYDKSVNLAKEILARGGEIPNARAQLELANGIKNSLYDQMYVAVKENEDERIQEFVENSISSIEEMLEKGENLGLTKKAISELESTLDVLINGNIDEILEKTSGKSEYAKERSESRGESGDAAGQNGDAPGQSGDAAGQNGDAPGQSGDAPGQSGDAPGQSGDAAGQSGDEGNPSENGFANGNDLGLGKIPPGLAKLFGYDDGTNDNANFVAPEGLPPGFGAAIGSASDTGIAQGQGLGLGKIPPGLAKFDVATQSLFYSPDDFYENSFGDNTEDEFQESYDSMNQGKGKGDGTKPKEPKVVKEEKPPKEEKEKEKEPKGGPSGIFDGNSGNIFGEVGVPYTIIGFTAVNATDGKDVKSSEIEIAIFNPNNIEVNTPTKDGSDQPFSFTPTNIIGNWEIRVNVPDLTQLIRIIDVAAIGNGVNVLPTVLTITAPASISDEASDVIGGSADDPDGDNTLLTYSWVQKSGPTGTITHTDPSSPSATFTAPFLAGGPNKDVVLALIVTDEDSSVSFDTVTITIINDSP